MYNNNSNLYTQFASLLCISQFVLIDLTGKIIHLTMFCRYSKI